jgi:FkbM family methyltransferase
MTVKTILLSNPIGRNMDGLAERINHVKDKVDLNSWKVIMDIGAMDGWEAVNFARVFPDALVFSFEPSPANVERCKATYALQSHTTIKNMALVNAAVTNKTGPIEFYAIDEEIAAQHGNVNWGMGSTLQIVDPKVLPWENSVQKTITAKGTRLDDFCTEFKIDKVDALWIDVQGAELHVLEGAGKVLENVQVIFTEAGLKPYYHGHGLKPEIDAFLETNGFVEIESARELHAQGLEVNAIYVNKRFMKT